MILWWWFQSLTKRQHDQQEAVWELLNTELSYISQIRVIIDVSTATSDFDISGIFLPYELVVSNPWRRCFPCCCLGFYACSCGGKGRWWEKSWLGMNANIVSPRRVLLEFCHASCQPFWQLATFPQLQCIVWPAGTVSMASRQLSALLPLLTLLQTPFRTLRCWYQNRFDGCHVNILCVSGVPKLSAQRSAGRPTEWGLSCVYVLGFFMGSLLLVCFLPFACHF